VLDETIDDAFKFSPDPNLTGWNPSMEINKIMEQMTTTYGRPTPTALLQNNTLFWSPYSPIDAPEVLFRGIEDCQEIMTLGDDPYTPMQLLNNAIRLLLGCGLYQRDFEEWDRKRAVDKVWDQPQAVHPRSVSTQTQRDRKHVGSTRIRAKCVRSSQRLG
jgi:hypothetical protein